MGDQRDGHMASCRRRIVGAAADQEAEDTAILAPGEQGVAGFPAEGLEIGDSSAVRGKNTEPGPGRQEPQLAIRPQHRQWAVQPFHVERGLGHGEHWTIAAAVEQAGRVRH